MTKSYEMSLLPKARTVWLLKVHCHRAVEMAFRAESVDPSTVHYHIIESFNVDAGLKRTSRFRKIFTKDLIVQKTILIRIDTKFPDSSCMGIGKPESLSNWRKGYTVAPTQRGIRIVSG